MEAFEAKAGGRAVPTRPAGDKRAFILGLSEAREAVNYGSKQTHGKLHLEASYAASVALGTW